jgi:hypothetical protein
MMMGRKRQIEGKMGKYPIETRNSFTYIRVSDERY